MPYDTPLVLSKTATEARFSPTVKNYSQAASTRAVANGVAQSNAISMRPIEPMLLLHQEQAKSLRLIGEAIGRGFRAMTRSFVA
jgi:hypothetical protein